VAANPTQGIKSSRICINADQYFGAAVLSVPPLYVLIEGAATLMLTSRGPESANEPRYFPFMRL